MQGKKRDRAEVRRERKSEITSALQNAFFCYIIKLPKVYTFFTEKCSYSTK